MKAWHRRALTCRICNQKFFPASLKFHMKVCAEKQEHVELPCDFCDGLFPCTVLQMHMKSCERHQRRERAFRDKGIQSHDRSAKWQEHRVGQTARLSTPRIDSAPKVHERQRPATEPPTARNNAKDPLVESYGSRSDHVIKGVGPRQRVDSSEGSASYDASWDGGEKSVDNAHVAVTTGDGRVACSNCQRYFCSERVGIHQDICRRVNTAKSCPNDDVRKGDIGKGTKKAASASSMRSSRRRSHHPFDAKRMTARVHGARGRSFFCDVDPPWRRISTRPNRTSSTSASVAGTLNLLSEDPYSVNAKKGNFLDSHGHGSLQSPELNGWCQSEAQHRPERQNSCAGSRYRHVNPAASHYDASSGERQPARRPSSAAGRTWSFDEARLSALGGECRTRLTPGRAVSMSCSPVRLRRSSSSTSTIRQARVQDPAKRVSIVGTRVGRVNGGGGRERNHVGYGNSSSITCTRKKKEPGPGVVDIAVVEREKLTSGSGFFFPSRDGWRSHLLKQKGRA